MLKNFSISLNPNISSKEVNDQRYSFSNWWVIYSISVTTHEVHKKSCAAGADAGRVIISVSPYVDGRMQQCCFLPGDERRDSGAQEEDDEGEEGF